MNCYLVFTDYKLHKVVDQSIHGEGRCARLTSDYIVKTSLTEWEISRTSAM